MTTEEHRPPATRIRQGAVLVLGAVVLWLVVGGDLDRFWLVPLLIGLAYLVAAVVGGPRGGYWATALVLVGWGAAVAWAVEGRPDLDAAGLYLTGAGLGAVAGVLLARRGFVVDPLGAAATIVAAGLFLALSQRFPDLLADGRTYAVLVAAVGVANIVAGLARRR
jgi:hypothetical protein